MTGTEAHDQEGSALGAGAAELAAALPRRAADAVQLLVDTIHDKAVRPATLIARAVVFGLLVAVLSLLVLVLGAIALMRVLDVYAFGHRMWLSYMVVGGLFAIGGLVLWSRRLPRPAGAND